MKSAMRLRAGLVACLEVGILVAGWCTGAAAAANSSGGLSAHPDKQGTRIRNSWDAKAAAAYLDRRMAW